MAALLKNRLFRSVALPTSVNGKIFLHSMLGRYEKFEDVSTEIKRLKIDTVVCLATEDEIKLKSPPYYSALQTKMVDWQMRMFPIPNFGAPSDKHDFLRLVLDLKHQLLSGKRLLIHCGGGIGRTGTLAVALLISLGLNLENAQETVAVAQAAPETVSQDQLLEWLIPKLIEVIGT